MKRWIALIVLVGSLWAGPAAMAGGERTARLQFEQICPSDASIAPCPRDRFRCPLDQVDYLCDPGDIRRGLVLLETGQRSRAKPVSDRNSTGDLF